MSSQYSKGKVDVSETEIGPKNARYKTTSNVEKFKTRLTQSPWRWIMLICVIAIVIAILVVPIVVTVHRNGDHTGTIADNWSNWMSFSKCSRSCGGGTKYRMRLCKSANQSTNAVGCSGNDKETVTCNTAPCSVNGAWAEWTSLTECSQSCGGGTQTFQRECDNPVPAHGGNTCVGNKQETRTCNMKDCPVHGSWGNWVEASGCSKTCGGGTIYRVRSCDNPAPTCDGKWCSGNFSDFQRCNTNPCLGHMSAYTAIYPKDGPSSGTVKLITAISNIGGDYNINTGQFVCQHPGIYVFTLHVYKEYGVHYAQCYIRKNGSDRVLAFSNPNNDNGYYESSNTVILDLTHGDIVQLGGCTSGNDTMYYWTSFSGYLLNG